MNAFSLAAAFVGRRPLPALLTVSLLALGIGTVTVVLLFERAFEDRLARDARGIDLVVGAKGSGLQLVLSSVFHADEPTGNVRLADLRPIARHPMVAGVIPLSLGDAFRGLRIVGTTHAYVDHYGGRLAEGRLWERSMEAVLGARAARETGLRTGMAFVGSHGLGAGGGFQHDDHPYRVVGVLEETGTVLDRVILVDTASVWEVHAGHGGERGTPHPAAGGEHGEHVGGHDDGHGEHGEHGEHEDEDGEHEDEHGHGGHGEDAERGHGEARAGVRGSGAAGPADGLPAGEGEVTALLVRYRTPLAAVRLPRAINAESALQAASPARESARLFLLLGTGLDAFRAFAALLVAASALSLFIALWHALDEQRYDLAVMRTLGATRGRILRFVLAQGAALGAAGAVLGVALGHAAGALLAGWLDRSRSVSLGGLGWAPEEGLVAAGAILVALAASAVPAVRACRLDPAGVLTERR